MDFIVVLSDCFGIHEISSESNKDNKGSFRVRGGGSKGGGEAPTLPSFLLPPKRSRA